MIIKIKNIDLTTIHDDLVVKRMEKMIGKIINKAILPIKEKAILSHIIEMFSPNHEFVIGTGSVSYTHLTLPTICSV